VLVSFLRLIVFQVECLLWLFILEILFLGLIFIIHKIKDKRLKVKGEITCNYADRVYEPVKHYVVCSFLAGEGFFAVAVLAVLRGSASLHFFAEVAFAVIGFLAACGSLHFLVEAFFGVFVVVEGVDSS
jgi:hypothetical protein